EFRVGPEGVVPTATGDPLAVFMFGDSGGDAFLQFLDGGCAVEADGKHVRAGAAQMHVGVIEARHDEVAAKLNALRAFLAPTAVEHDFEAADACDLAFADSHCGRPG